MAMLKREFVALALKERPSYQDAPTKKEIDKAWRETQNAMVRARTADTTTSASHWAMTACAFAGSVIPNFGIQWLGTGNGNAYWYLNMGETYEPTFMVPDMRRRNRCRTHPFVSSWGDVAEEEAGREM